MTQETVRALSDGELAQVIAWGQSEVNARAEKRKQEAIAKIKELAAEVGVNVSVAGVRGRPSAVKMKKKLPQKTPRTHKGEF